MRASAFYSGARRAIGRALLVACLTALIVVGPLRANTAMRAPRSTAQPSWLRPTGTAWQARHAASVPNGTYTLTALARDAAGNVTTSAPITVTVMNPGPVDTTPPTVALTTPADGAAVNTVVTLSAAASDNVGVAGVQFRLNGADLGPEDTTSPYSITWNTATIGNGVHTLTATARDAAGNTATSTPRTVTVSNLMPLTQLVAAYAFDEGAGLSALDSSPTQNRAVLAGAGWGVGRSGSALAANGVGYAEAADRSALSPGLTATFEAWVFLTGAPTEPASILNKWSQSSDDEYLFGLDTSRRVYLAWQTTGGAIWGTPSFNDAASAGQVPLNVWTHVAVVRNGPVVSFYINGSLSSSVTAMDANPFRNGTNSLRVGSQSRGGRVRAFPGRIDDARLYRRALAPAEIQLDMNTPISAPGSQD